VIVSCQMPDLTMRGHEHTKSCKAPLAAEAPVGRKARREHRGKCGGRARQPRGHHFTGFLWEVLPAFCCGVTEVWRFEISFFFGKKRAVYMVRSTASGVRQ